MRICFLAHAASIHTCYWAEFFRDRGHKVTIVSLTEGTVGNGIELITIPQRRKTSIERSNWHYLLSLPRLQRVIREVRPDILNAHFLTSYGLLGALTRPRSTPLVISLHGSDVLLIPRRSTIHGWSARYSLGQADLLISVAEHMTRRVREMIGPDKQVLTLQYGVDTDQFFPPDDGASRTPVCLSVRRLIPLANIETILVAARILRDQGSELQFEISNLGYLRPDLEKLAGELGINGTVTFLGHIDRDEMARALRTSCIYVSMTSSDGTSLSLLEAMACGAFPVVSDIPANREWIRHGENGYLVPLNEPESLATWLSEAWHANNLRQDAAAMNWQLVRERGEYKKNMGIIEKAFCALIEDRDRE